MADLSLPPLSLLPLEGERMPPLPSAVLSPPESGFAWPTPAFASYPAPSAAATPDACEVEGTNGKAMTGRLMGFDPRNNQILLRLTASRSAMVLRFDQFRRLRLLQSLNAAPSTDDSPQGEVLSQRPALPYRVELKGGQVLEGLTLTHEERDYGLFLFEPVDMAGAVRRSFIPRSAYDSASVGLKLGESLVEQSITTPEQLLDALQEQKAMREQKLGDLLVERQVITPEALGSAIEEQARMPMVKLGEALLALGFINQQQLEETLAQQRTDRSVPIGQLLVRKNLVSPEQLQMALARKMGYPLVDVQHFPAEAEAIARLPYATASRLKVLPLMLRAGRLVLALEDPSRRDVIDEVEFSADCKAVPVLATTGALSSAIDRAYQKLGVLEFDNRGGDLNAAPVFEQLDTSQLLATLDQPSAKGHGDEDDDGPAIEQSDNSLVRLINSMIMDAHTQGVSDIHIESHPGREKVRIRFRKDGVLKPYLELPHTYRNSLIARLKIMCDLDISERRKPQDGKINFSKYMQGVKLELRVATIPTYGNLEDAVLRLLASSKPVPLNALNLSPTNLERLMAVAERPCGMVLCVGPTGSGKTTTLHSVLGHINTPERKIWTAEDPIEITQPGLRQVQVNPKIDWTFAKALRAFLRADPDVVMVGEIRDEETAQTAIEASLTGHLVLSTLHTNSAAETVTRLLDMGMDPFNFGDALLGVLAQRLVRRLCSQCKTSAVVSTDQVDELLRDYRHAFGDWEGAPTDDELLSSWRARFGLDGKLRMHSAGGCSECDGTGLRGRTGIHELLIVSRPIRGMIQTGARAEQLLQQGLAEGMRTLRQDGIEKVLAGVTTLEEVRAASNG